MVECETDNFVIEVQLFFSVPIYLCNSTGRVPALHAEGYRFESYHEYQIKDTHSNTLMDKTLTSNQN